MTSTTGRAALAAAFLFFSISLAPAGAQDPTEPGWKRDGLFGVSHSSGFKVELTGYVQGDLRSPRNVFEGDDEDEGLNDTTTELRRVRIGVDGEWKRLSFQAQFDPNDDNEHVKDLYAEVKLHDAFRVRAGHFKVPVSREFLTSGARIDFVDRHLVADDVGAGRDWGVMVRGEPRRLDYMVGLFRGDGTSKRYRAETTVAGRLVVSPWKWMDLAGSFSQGDVEAQPAGGDLDPVPLGFSGTGPSGFRFYDPHFVNGRRRRVGADVHLASGPVSLTGEWLRGEEARRGQGAIFDDLPGEVATGWSVTATWLVTGDRKKRTIEPEKPVHRGGIGAVELAARYEELEFDDDGPDAGFAGAGSRARNIRPVADRVITAGLSWWPVEWIRLMGNVAWERFEDPLLAPEPGRRGEYVTVLGRLQFQVP